MEYQVHRCLYRYQQKRSHRRSGYVQGQHPGLQFSVHGQTAGYCDLQRQQGLLQVCQHTVEQDLPDVAQQDAADQVGHEVDGTEDVGAADAAGERQRNGKGADVDEHGGNYSERRSKAERVQEGGILKYAEVVLNAHKGGLAHSGEPLERKVNTPDKGPDKADDERDEGRQHEHRPVFTDGFLHDVPPICGVVNKKGEAGRTTSPASRFSSVSVDLSGG